MHKDLLTSHDFPVHDLLSSVLPQLIEIHAIILSQIDASTHLIHQRRQGDQDLEVFSLTFYSVMYRIVVEEQTHKRFTVAEGT